jgi:hypothetical protein
MTEPNDDDLNDQETERQPSWIRLSPETMNKLCKLLSDNREAYFEFQEKQENMAFGEAAILWLMDRVLDRWSMKKEPKSADVFAPSVALMRHKETGKVYIYICRGQMSGYKHIWSHEFDESKCCWIKDDEVEAYYDLDGK